MAWRGGAPVLLTIDPLSHRLPATEFADYGLML
jgi:hypothetical protein